MYNQLSTPGCFSYNVPNHVMEDRSFLGNHIGHILDQMNALFSRPGIDPYVLIKEIIQISHRTKDLIRMPNPDTNPQTYNQFPKPDLDAHQHLNATSFRSFRPPSASPSLPL